MDGVLARLRPRREKGGRSSLTVMVRVSTAGLLYPDCVARTTRVSVSGLSPLKRLTFC